MLTFGFSEAIPSSYGLTTIQANCHQQSILFHHRLTHSVNVANYLPLGILWQALKLGIQVNPIDVKVQLLQCRLPKLCTGKDTVNPGLQCGNCGGNVDGHCRNPVTYRGCVCPTILAAGTATARAHRQMFPNADNTPNCSTRYRLAIAAVPY